MARAAEDRGVAEDEAERRIEERLDGIDQRLERLDSVDRRLERLEELLRR